MPGAQRFDQRRVVPDERQRREQDRGLDFGPPVSVRHRRTQRLSAQGKPAARASPRRAAPQRSPGPARWRCQPVPGLVGTSAPLGPETDVPNREAPHVQREGLLARPVFDARLLSASLAVCSALCRGPRSPAGQRGNGGPRPAGARAASGIRWSDWQRRDEQDGRSHQRTRWRRRLRHDQQQRRRRGSQSGQRFGWTTGSGGTTGSGAARPAPADERIGRDDRPGGAVGAGGSATGTGRKGGTTGAAGARRGTGRAGRGRHDGTGRRDGHGRRQRGQHGTATFQKAAGTIQNTTEPASTTNLQKSQWQQGLISPSLTRGTHLNQPAVVNGYLMVAGNEDFFFYDVSNATSPKQLSKMSTPNRRVGGEAESHTISFARSGNTFYMVTLSGFGIDTWDVTSVTAPEAPRAAQDRQHQLRRLHRGRSGASPGRGSTSTSAPPTTASRSSTRPIPANPQDRRRGPHVELRRRQRGADRRDRQRPRRHDAEGEQRHRDAGHQQSDRADAGSPRSRPAPSRTSPSSTGTTRSCSARSGSGTC